MNKTKQLLLAAIAAACNFSIAEAEENLNGTIQYLQELKLEDDFRRMDMYEQCEGLLGVRYNPLFMEYATEQMQDENIPDDLKAMHEHDEDYVPDTENEFNPFEYAGMLGEDVMEDLINMGY